MNDCLSKFRQPVFSRTVFSDPAIRATLSRFNFSDVTSETMQIETASVLEKRLAAF